MNTNREEQSTTGALRRIEALREYQFTSGIPVVGGLIARLREAWNSVATKWQGRAFIEQQSEFNRALVDWLERPPGLTEVDELFALHDRRRVAVNREAAVLSRRLERPHRAGSRPRVAYFSPLPPSRSGIADYSKELLPHLARLADITIFAEVPAAVSAAGFEVRPPAEFPSRQADFDVPLYQMGNSDQHEGLYEMLLRYPGIVVLHDFYLHHFIRHHTIGRGDWTGYGRELGYASGSRGRNLARAIGAGEAEAPLFEVPLNDRVIDSAVGMIVHSHFVAERVRRARPDLPLAVIPALVELRDGRSIRPDLGLPDEVIVFGSFGQITAEKQIDVALEAFRGLRQGFPNAHYLLAGEAQADVELDNLLENLELGDSVYVTGFAADLADFINRIHSVDVVVNLRQPTVGETSAIALRAMAAARPLIVYDHGWYRELPDSAALKVPPGDVRALEQAMAVLAGSAELRRSMGRSGFEYASDHCRPPVVAAAYHAFIESVLEPDYA